MAEINGWRGLQNLAERKTGRIVESVAERWRCCSKPVTGHLWKEGLSLHNGDARSVAQGCHYNNHTITNYNYIASQLQLQVQLPL